MAPFKSLSYVLASAALSTFVFATPLTRRAMSVHDDRTLPQSFVASGKPATDTILNLRVALTAVNMSGLETVLYDVSTPGSAHYGQHLSFDEVKSYASPTPEAASAVTSWLQENGGVSDIATSGAFGNWITFSTDVSTANSLLNADFQNFTHVASGATMVRTLSYSLPQDLLQHIDLVHPTTSFARIEKASPISKHRSTPRHVAPRADAAPASCNSTVTPTCLQDLYAIPTTKATQSSNKIAVAGFSDEWPQDADLKTFLTKFRPDISSSTTFSTVLINEGVDPQGTGFAGQEADLDVEYTVGLATNVPVTFMSVGPASSGPEEFIDLFESLAAEASPPQVVTTSYAFNEADVGASLATLMCNSYMTLGARGVSLLFSSGDGGVAGITSESCTSFVPTFPATCPFVTAVGATENVPEIGGSFSSGGFSDIFSVPSYQSAEVSSHLSKMESTNSGLFNTTGRGFPDVSAIGVEIAMTYQGSEVNVWGTSCSSPIFASVIALINDRLVAAGKPVLGFLNPFLYANPTALFDITTGDNPGCGTNGFSATTGWDPVTGLGTPSFTALLAAAGI